VNPVPKLEEEEEEDKFILPQAEIKLTILVVIYQYLKK
jgi:hypothetical protein